MTPDIAIKQIESDTKTTTDQPDPTWVVIENWQVCSEKIDSWLRSESLRLQSVGLYIFAELSAKNLNFLPAALTLFEHPWEQARANLLEGLLPHVSTLDPQWLNKIKLMKSNGDKNLEKYIGIANALIERMR